MREYTVKNSLYMTELQWVVIVNDIMHSELAVYTTELQWIDIVNDIMHIELAVYMTECTLHCKCI